MNNSNKEFFSGYFNGQPFGNNQENFIINPMSPEEQYNTLLYNVSNNLDYIKELLYYMKNNLILRDDKQGYEYYEKNDRKIKIDQFDAQLVLFVLNNNIDISEETTDESILKTYLKPYIINIPDVTNSSTNNSTDSSTNNSKTE